MMKRLLVILVIACAIVLPVYQAFSTEQQPAIRAEVEETVYVTKTGEKYHKSTCGYLAKSKRAMILSDAKAAGYTPCSRCKPPR